MHIMATIIHKHFSIQTQEGQGIFFNIYKRLRQKDQADADRAGLLTDIATLEQVTGSGLVTRHRHRCAVQCSAHHE